MAKQLDMEVSPSNFAFGDLFEQMVILEFFRLNDYFESDFTFSYLRSGAGVEIDLVVDRPGKKTVLAEIKSTDKVTEPDMKSLRSFAPDFPEAERMVLCREKRSRKTNEGILIAPWQSGIKQVFGIKG